MSMNMQHHAKNQESRGLYNSKTVVGNFVALGSSEVLARLIGFAATIYLTRVLGPEGFGVIGFAAALVAYFSLGVSAGFNDVGAREVARQPHEATSIALSVIVVRLALATVSLVALVGIAYLLDKPLSVKLVTVSTGLLLFASAVDTSWVYKGLERTHIVGLTMVLAQALYLGITVLIVQGPTDVLLAPIAQFLGELGAALLLAGILFHRGGEKFALHRGFTILIQSGFLLLTKLGRTMIFCFDVVLIGFLLGEREVGLYTAAYRFCFLPLAIAAALQMAYLPAFARAADRGKEPMVVLVNRSFEMSAALSFPMMIGGWLLAKPLLYTLYGAAFIQAEEAFRLLLISIGLIFFYGAVHNVLLACHKLRVGMYIVATGAGLNTVLNLLLVPSLGLLGAALVMVATESMILAIGFLVLWKLGIRFNLQPLLRPCLAAGVMGAGLVVLGSGHHLVVVLTVGFLVYVSTLLIFRGVPQDALPYLRTRMFPGSMRGISLSSVATTEIGSQRECSVHSSAKAPFDHRPLKRG